MKRRTVSLANVLALMSMLVLCAVVAWSVPRLLNSRESAEPEAVLQEVMELIEAQYVTDVPREQLIKGALKGMTDTLDIHSRTYTEDEWRRFSSMSEGREPGIGIRFAKIGEAVVVLRVIPESPADDAGLRAAEQIRSLAGHEIVAGASAQDVKSFILGAGTTFEIEVSDWPDATATRKIDVTRGAYKLESVFSRVIQPDEFPETAAGGRLDAIGYLQILTFNHQTGEDFRDQLSDLLDRGVGGLVLDLRGNGGGTLQEAVKVVASFLETDRVLTSVYRDASRFYPTLDPVLAPDRPVVVLVNGGSASASEVAVGALQDYRRALVLGEHSLGKGVIQTVYKLASRETGVKLTTARYLTPAGRSLQKKRQKPRNAMERGGIIPDVVLPISARDWRDIMELRDRQTMPGSVARALQAHPKSFRTIPEGFRDRQLDAAIAYLATGRRPVTALK